MKAGLPGRALRLAPYPTPEEVRRLCGNCQGRRRDWDTLLILLFFQTGGLAGRQCPFRQYFSIHSEHHLIDNVIVTRARDTFNAMAIANVSDVTQTFLKQGWLSWGSAAAPGRLMG